MIKLIGIDLDGTLLNSKLEVPIENKQSIVKALDKGIHVYLVTGRPYCFAKHLALEIDDRVQVISSNGANYEIDNIMTSKYIETTALETVITELSKEEVCAFFKGNANFYTHEAYDDRFLYSHMNEDLPKALQVTSYTQLSWRELHDKTHDILKILVYTLSKETLERLRKRLSLIEHITLTSYNAISFDINAEGVSKGNAILEIMKKMNIQKNEILAIGDNENDVSMFEVCGHCVAMENANQQIKQMSEYITSSNDDYGVANAIDYYIED
ncbi:Cof subfamily protein (haloacid dehalogenase superfamily) [Breznakia sp. PF5-3]|uniref:Cof-type HAD-IIB family hydrolase n=1 Tax=unclassified Breznakia TaxID=2623764 RepID=UPI00240631F7|nr:MULTISPECIES: Cof-type HAD-IIB family hydrolase [unclassified Breznakia]MDF9825883.1 Cof subfamily protein (haloacid dehalogenase superfamily) [Breznakia sp. PM6-1]MDF9836679.1 Cof subfamily protein (haloacid dehalogenase superfamily) [Breznakia sp. PF5-3]MDL2276938.1 Cof-type HAD-IIB family hydrolase [Breznakia sp. OttesenSCG-928-G09]